MLYIVGTPIGNIKDITLRALEVFEEVDLILAEDTRQTVKLLNKYEIKTKLKSYHKHNENALKEMVLAKLREGRNIALVSDAGMPLVCDPGASLVLACREEGLDYTTVPSATALISALVMSGFSALDFRFLSFLPSKNKERKAVYESMQMDTSTLIFYEAPHRIKKTLTELTEYLGANRKLALVREITKLHEEVAVKPLYEWVEFFKTDDLKGEMVIVIEADNSAENTTNSELLSLIKPEKHLNFYMKKGLSKNEAIKQIAKDRGLKKSEVYSWFLNE